MPHFPTFATADDLAEVRTRDSVMRYRRSGTGPALLLLRDPGVAEPLWPELEQALGFGFRVIVPELGDHGGTPPRLQQFLEGMGCHRIAVLATGDLCIPALELALGGREQVSRLVLVPDGTPADGAVEGMLGDAVREAPVALRIVRRGVAADEALPLIVPFLAGRH